ncbi:MAG: endolytic transglycosylase MltG [Chitinophagales bacterium]|nr:endolytic transglycosylase MltG [Chitinophagales bacterium]
MYKKFLIILIIPIVVALLALKFLFGDNIKNNNNMSFYELYVPNGATFDMVLDSLNKNNILKNKSSFVFLAKRMNYPNVIKAGRYIINNNASNFSLVRKLRGGLQTPVKITFNNIKDKNDFITKMSNKLEFSYDELAAVIDDTAFQKSLGLNADNITTIFIANTYEFYWTVSAEKFVQKLYQEYERFWTDARKQQAKKINLNPTTVTILASIVQKESAKHDEQSRIAGVYINRLNKNMKLQADPTVLFALQKLGFSRRVTYNDLKVDSPYNTYKYAGLPPGPICFPEASTIKAVLNAENHSYLFFCAKEDFSGYHNFAVTWQEHQVNAKKYQQALNERAIK